ncbi:MAG: insulinase family protein [Pirellulales bacterium]|nr:insulinase family protein [Pirellulales bacterium]
MEFVRHTLPSGLEIVAELNGDARSVALGFFVEAGSRDETEEVSGVSHFLEHMAFKGTPTRSALDVNREFDEMGARYNASTGEETTLYYAAVLPECQDRAVRLLADILRPSLREDDFNTEKQVILEEIRVYEDQPPFGADEKCKAAYFGAHPLGRSVLGTAQSITALSAEAMRRYFRARYSPSNIVLAATGRIDFDALIATAEESCGVWERFDAPRSIRPAEPNQKFLTVHRPEATQEYTVQMSDGPAGDEKQRYAAKLLARILGDDSGSRLYWALSDPGLAEHAVLRHYEYAGAGLFVTYMSCEPERTADNLQVVLDIYRNAQTAGVSKEELSQAKSKVSSRIVLSSERPMGRLSYVGNEWVQRRRYRSVREALDTVASISVDDIQSVLTGYPLSRSTTVTIGPLAEVPQPA